MNADSASTQAAKEVHPIDSRLLKAYRVSTTPLLKKLYHGLTNSIRLCPDFLIIGTQRGGTTSLYHYLQAHPCIGAATTKEIHFFDRRFREGLAWYRAHFPTRVEKYYAQHLRGHPFLTGEASPDYLFHPHAAKRVAEMLPHVKLIVLLRNPVDRAYSHYHHAVDLGFERLPFEEAIQWEEECLAEEREKMLKDEWYESPTYMELSYLSKGRYVEQLQTWMRLFPREQCLILKSEEFYARPAATLQQVVAFLNLPEIEHRGGRTTYQKYNSKTNSQMDPALRKRLLAYFEPHNADLYAYLGVNFDWERGIQNLL